MTLQSRDAFSFTYEVLALRVGALKPLAFVLSKALVLTVPFVPTHAPPP